MHIGTGSFPQVPTHSLTICSTKLKFFQSCNVVHLYRLLGKNIAHFRLAADLTQEELAEKTDYSVGFIGLVERGINAPTVARLKDIADAVGVDIWQLFYPDAISGKRPAAGKKPHSRGGAGKR
ncbi:MAG: helix-turn-helix domain-containing protein [Acidobacteriia bacterium]|nr:helix-turn-helix domain-containing protein [Terriglobia bacterium]